MDLADLRTFLVVAQHANLHRAALELHQSPSALSKAIRRIENLLRTPLFDRIGKRVALNPQGVLLRERAVELIALADRVRADFRGDAGSVHCRIAGPAILQWRFGAQLSALLTARYPAAGVSFSVQYEDAALAAVARAEADFALISGTAMATSLPVGLDAMLLGSTSMQLAAGPTHPLARQVTGPNASVKASRSSKALRPDTGLLMAQILPYGFACPTRALFSGLERGARSDGWRDDQLPRRVQWWVDDLQLLVALVRAGQALAYLPAFAIAEAGLIRLPLIDCPYQCTDQIWLAWRSHGASGWQHQLLDALRMAMNAGSEQADYVPQL